MSVQVEDVMTAKSGKSLRVKLGGTWYGASLDSGLNGAKGKIIEAECQTSDKFGPWIKGWKEVAAPQGTPPLASGSPASRPAAAATHYAGEPGDNITPWYMPFVSNTVAHAIEKGLIQDPNAINQWALKAAQVAQAVKEAVK